jgi:hypothetical protein
MFENMMLRKIFAPKRDEVTGECKRLYTEDVYVYVYALYSSPNVIRVNKSGKPRWAGHVARMGDTEVHTGFWLGDTREKYYLEDLYLDGSIILKWLSKKWDVATWTELLWLRITTRRTAPVSAVMIIQVP